MDIRRARKLRNVDVVDDRARCGHHVEALLVPPLRVDAVDALPEERIAPVGDR